MTDPLTGRLPASRRCKGPRCELPVAFAITSDRHTQIIDPEPAAGGNLIVWRAPGVGGPRLRSRVEAADALFDPDAGKGDRYTDHHATCIDADRF